MITQLNPGNLGPTARATNEKLMAGFIQADLPRWVGLDTRAVGGAVWREFLVQLRAGRVA